MFTYRAMYQEIDGCIHAEVLDFPGCLTCGDTMDAARELLAGALVDLAETLLLEGKPLPKPDPTRSDPEADLEEPIHLVLSAGHRLDVSVSSKPYGVAA